MDDSLSVSVKPTLATVLSGIRAVAFDAVGTLITAQPSVSSAYVQVLSRICDQPADVDKVRQVLSARLSERTHSQNLQTSEDQERTFWWDLIAELVCRVDLRQTCFDALFEHFASPQNWQCFSDTAATLSWLKSRGMHLVLASNFDSRLHPVKNGLCDLQAIDQVVVSSEVGWRKPAAPFFNAVCSVVNCSPEEVLFVGDDLTADVLGSSQAGMRSVWLNRHNATASPLTGCDVLTVHSLCELCVE